MPKLKTHSGVKDRIKLTKTGKVMHRHASINHFLNKKTATRKRRLSGKEHMTGKPAKNMKVRLGK